MQSIERKSTQYGRWKQVIAKRLGHSRILQRKEQIIIQLRIMNHQVLYKQDHKGGIPFYYVNK